jgi:Holliday junction resolvase RusA-like endonuclease
MLIDFTVRGLAAPQGSKSVGRSGQMYESNKRLEPWRKLVHDQAEQAVERWCRRHTSVAESTELRAMFEGPVTVTLWFQFERPKTHYGTGYNSTSVKASAPRHPSAKSHLNGGDVDKLARAVLDAMTGVVYKDDAQVVQLAASKAYAATSGLYVWVRPAPPTLMIGGWRMTAADPRHEVAIATVRTSNEVHKGELVVRTTVAGVGDVWFAPRLGIARPDDQVTVTSRATVLTEVDR